MSDQSLTDLRREADDRRDAIARDVELVTDRVDPSRVAGRQKAKLNQRVSGLRNSVFGSSDRNRFSNTDSDDSTSVSDRASDAMQQVKDSTPDSVGEFTEGNPLAAGLIGLGVGLLASTLIPTTPEEQRLVDDNQDSIDTAARQMARSGQKAAEAVKPAVENAAAEVKSSAQDSAQSVKGDAKAAASDVQAHAKDKAQDIKSD